MSRLGKKKKKKLITLLNGHRKGRGLRNHHKRLDRAKRRGNSGNKHGGFSADWQRVRRAATGLCRWARSGELGGGWQRGLAGRGGDGVVRDGSGVALMVVCSGGGV